VEVLSKLEDANKPITNEEVKKVGEELAGALFADDIKIHFENNLKELDQKIMRIRIKAGSNVPNYPWELLYYNGEYLSVSQKFSLVRGIPGVSDRNGIEPEIPLQILIICASPQDERTPQLDILTEIQSIQTALQDLEDEQVVKIDRIFAATRENISEQLDKKQYNIIHFIGHGLFYENKGYLALEKKANKMLDMVSVDEIGNMFSGQHKMALVVLNTCKGAAANTGRAFTGMAQYISEKTYCPAVIAMRYSISDRIANVFAQRFYTNVQRMAIDANLQSVRSRIWRPEMADLNFAKPVLFMNSLDGME